MKHKILFSILSILGIASIVGQSLLPEEELFHPTPKTISIASPTKEEETILSNEDIPLHSWITSASEGESITFEHLTYTLEESRISVTCEDEEAVETLYLYSYLKPNQETFYRVFYNSIDFSLLTHVKKILAFSNDPFYSFRNCLTKIPNPYDLYLSGYFKELVSYPNIKELYICEAYDTNTSDISASTDPHKLAQTHITKIHYANWNQRWTSVNRFSHNEIENVDGVTISIDFLSEEELGYRANVFYPFEGFIPEKNYLGAVAYPIYEGVQTKVLPENISYVIDQIHPKVHTFILPFDINLTNYGTFDVDTLVIQNKDFNPIAFLNAHINTLVVKEHASEFNFNRMSHIKNVWFAPTVTPPTITTTGYNLTANAKLEHIYIPNAYKDAYQKLSGEFFDSRVVYYDMNDLPEYQNTFTSTNGNIYYTNNESLSIDTLESYITEMTEGNFIFTTTEALDIQYQAYLETKSEESAPSDKDDFVDDSEFVQGYQALGAIYYTSTKSLEDILKIAANYILQKDGVRTDEEKEVSFHIDGDTLSVIIKVNDKIVASVVSKLHKLDTKDYGEFIYLQNVATFNGVFLFDTTSTTTKTPTEIYQYLLSEVTNAKTIPTPDFKEFSLTAPSSVDISSSLIHTNGNQYKVNMECLSFPLEEAKDLSNPEITFKKVISPDDEQEDAESEYAVKTITKIYLPNALDARGVPSSINESILTYQNTPYTDKTCLHTLTSTNKKDGKDYSIQMAGTLPDSVWYEHTIPVAILKDTYSCAYVLCEDQTLIILLPYTHKLTKEDLTKEINTFLTQELRVTEPKLSLVETLNLTETKTTTGSTYQNGSIDIVVSGVASLLTEQVEDKPNPPAEDKTDEDIKDILDDFKENFENNKTFKTMSIILGTILGLVIIYVGYLIGRKIYRWLKK